MSNEIEITKDAITTEAGGARGPARGYDSSIKLPRNEEDLEVEDEDLDVLVVTPPKIAKALIDGESSLLVLPVREDIPSGKYFLLGAEKVLGVVELGRSQVVREESALLAQEKRHLISKSLLDEWGGVQFSWQTGPWEVWPASVIEKFEPALEVTDINYTHTRVDNVSVPISKAIFGSSAGKSRIAKRLVAMIPEHKTYVEPFAGSAAVLFEKEPSATEIVNDLDPDIAHAFRTIKSITKKQVEALRSKDWVGSKKTFLELDKTNPEDDLDKLYKFLYQSRFAYGKWRKRSGFDPYAEGTTAKTMDRVEKYAGRLKDVQIFSGDYSAMIEKFDAKDTFFYFDPPYTGYDSDVGEFDFNDETFVKNLGDINGKFLITCGVKGKLPGLLRKAGYTTKRIRTTRYISNSQSARNKSKALYQVIATNYEPPTKKFEGVVIEEWTKALEDIEKIKDVNDYKPPKLDDKVLRDDFRIALAWYATWRKNPDNFEYNIDTIDDILRKIIKELVRRGSKVVTFDPAGMKSSVRAHFLALAKEVGVPKEMYKRVELTRETDPEELTRAELTAAHWQLHVLFDEASGGKPKDWTTEDIVNLHAKVVDRLFSLGSQQPPPPDNGLDELSADFEDHADDQKVDYYEEPSTKIEKRDLMVVNHSGNCDGEAIKIGDVLPHLQDFRLRMPYIYLVGGLANHGETEGDIDILVNEDEDFIAPWLRDVIEFRLGRSLPSELSKRLQIHYDRARGPFTNHVELYNLRCERVSGDEVKQMALNDDGVDEIDIDPENAQHTYWEFHASFEDLNDLDKILTALRDAATGPLKSEVIDECSERFDPQGVTALLLLSTSHIAIHTWPEDGLALLDILSCNVDGDLRGAIDSVVEALAGWDAVEKKASEEELPFRPPFVTYGLLTRFHKTLMPLFPKTSYKKYVELFCGNGEMIWCHPKRAQIEVMNDLDPTIIRLHRTIQGLTDKDFEKLEKCDWLGSKAHFEKLAKAKTPTNDLDNLYREIYLRRFAKWGRIKLRFNEIGEGQTMNYLPRLHKCNKRVQGVTFTNLDYRKCIAKYDSKDTFFFMDPPYPEERGYYPLALRNTEEQAEAFSKIKGPAMLVTEGHKETMGPLRKMKGWTEKRFQWPKGWHHTSGGPKEAFTLASIFMNYKATSKRLMWEIEEPRLWQVADQIGKAKEAKLELGKQFPMPKPTRPAYPGTPQTVDGIVALFEGHDGWLPTYIEKKYDGANHQIHRNGDAVTILSEDGGDNTDRLPGVVAAVKALKPEKLILCAEIERWEDGRHMPREAAAGYLNGKDEPDDSAMVANVYDVLLVDGEDLHAQSTEERLSKLEALGIAQSTMGVPDIKQRLNASPAVLVDDLETLRKTVERYRRLPGSEGVVCKQKDAPYPLAEVTPDTWVKFHNETVFSGLVYEMTKTKGNVWVYRYGVLPGKDEPIETLMVDGVKITPVGESFGTKIELSKGDLICIAAETVNFEHRPEGVAISAWVPRVLEQTAKKSDTVDEVVARARKDLVLDEKTIDDAGVVTYQPTVKTEKQADPYLEVPPEDGKYRFVVQHHWRGKTVHADLRVEMKARGLLLGWTLNTEIKGVIDEPVTSLAAAKEWSTESGLDKISKINWLTGKWATRPKGGTDKLVRTEILSERKAPEPNAWIDVEGKTKDPVAGEPPPVGGTRNFPGVFDIVAQGAAEYGAQKPWFHEYWLHGDGTNYRLIFRQLKMGRAKTEKCEVCGGTATGALAWEESAPADLCLECVRKADVVLPPSEDQPLGTEGFAWLAIQPDDQTPYVLGSEAVTKRWMPNNGDSALPVVVRSQVPKEHRYWQKSGDAARKARDELVTAIKTGQVKLDYESVFKAEKASLLEADFVLQEQTWRGPVQVRLGPTTTKYWIRLDIGRTKLLAIQLATNPLDNKSAMAQVEYDSHKSSMELSGRIPPGHYLNPTKETPSFIEILDSGSAEVTSLSKDLVKVQFKGKQLKGLYLVTRNVDEWLWSKEKSTPETKTVKKAEDGFELYFPFEWVRVEKKGKDAKRLVTGIVLEPHVVDGQKDWESDDVIERAAHNFLANYNLPKDDGGTQIGLMHKTFGDVGVELVESYIAPEDFHLGGVSKSKKVKKGSWVMTVHISSDKTWEDVQNGKLTGFSVGGTVLTAGNGK